MPLGRCWIVCTSAPRVGLDLGRAVVALCLAWCCLQQHEGVTDNNRARSIYF